MSDKSEIQWTDATWNPVTGCTKVSPGCANCYIQNTPPFRIAGRRFVKGHIPLELHANRLEQPLSWRKPRRVFVNSLSDLFHDDVQDSLIDEVFAVMALAPQHTFQVLTKRPERMRAYCSSRLEYEGIGRELPILGNRDRHARVRFPLPNVWLGVSVENQHFADERIPLLLQTPAAVRFISAEPLLGPVELMRGDSGRAVRDWLHSGEREVSQTQSVWITGLDWVIVGGESGPGARPFDLAWARSIVGQCQAGGVPVFVKQLGANPVVTDATCSLERAIREGGYTIRDRKGGDMAEWPEDLRVREFPARETP